MSADTTLAILASVVVAHALAVISPGPDFAVLVRQALARGRRAGIATAAGIASGIVVHVSYGLFGLGWLLTHWPGALSLIAMAGALFLLWLGSLALRAQPTRLAVPRARPEAEASHRDFLIGLGTNLLNPKASLFFIALFSGLLGAPLSAALKVMLAIWLPLATFAWFAALALLLSRPALRERLHRHGWRIDRAMGAVLVALGLLVLWRELQTLM